MDPIAALNAALSLLTFVQVDCQLLADEKRPTGIANGKMKTTKDIRLCADQLSSLCDELETTTRAPREIFVGPDDPALLHVCQQSIVASQELCHALGIVVAQPNQSWPSARAAIRTVLGERDIRSLERRLAHCTSEVQTHLLSVLRPQNSVTQARLDAISAAQQRMHLPSRYNLWFLREDLVSMLSTKRPAESIRNLTAIEHGMCTFRQNLDSESLQLAVLSSLDFPYKTAQHRGLRHQHRHTFGWIFESAHANMDVRFIQWLKSDANWFMIYGKAGSGKSTLLKYIFSHHSTRTQLIKWAGAPHLLTVEFLFWDADTPLPKCLEAVLRALLFQLCRQQPHWTPAVWERAAPHNYDLNSRECLLDVIELLPSLPKLSTKYCYFIDSVDELSGEPCETIRAIKAIAGIPNVKVCCSSRSRDIAESSCVKSTGYILSIHDHTKDDISDYVTSTLCADPAFIELLSLNSNYGLVVPEILERAEGSFSWVRLVVSNLIDVLAKKDAPEKLLCRVREMPRDLEARYGHILDEIERPYRRQSAILMRMLIHAKTPLPAMVAEYVMHSNPELDLSTMPLKIWSIADRSMYSKPIQSKVKSLCLDLIEAVPPDANLHATGVYVWTLKCTHQTAFDFLAKHETRRLLDSRAGADALSPERELCRAYLYLLKTLPLKSLDVSDGRNEDANSIDGSVGRNAEASAIVRQLLVYARTSEQWSMPILREAERVMRAQMRYPTSLERFSLTSWSMFPRPFPSSHKTNLLFPYAVAMSMTQYVSECLKNDPSLVKDAYGMDAFIFILHGFDLNKGFETPDYSSVASILLSHGADASNIFLLYHTWSSNPKVIEWCRMLEPSERKKMVPLFELLARHRYVEATNTPGTFRIPTIDAYHSNSSGPRLINFASFLDVNDIKRLESATPPDGRIHENTTQRSTNRSSQRTRARLSLRNFRRSFSKSAKHQ